MRMSWSVAALFAAMMVMPIAFAQQGFPGPSGLIDDLVASELRPVAFPGQFSLTAPLGGTGDRELTALFAGQSAALASDTTAGTLVDSLAEATSEYLRLFAHC
jgi:hypothetical protein